LLAAVIEQDELVHNQQSSEQKKAECQMLKLLFNLIDRPDKTQRSMILSSCIQFIKLVGPMSVNNYLLPQCWQNLNDKSDERRMLIAEACAHLAPHIYNDIRSSLIFSILKEIIEEEKSHAVRACATRSLAMLINYLNDEQKFNQVILHFPTTIP
jgi:hypothetical protein